MKLYEYSANQLAGLLKKGEISSRQLTESVFESINEKEPEIHAFLSLSRESALKTADEVDEARRQNQPLGIFAGIPIAIKDNMCTNGIRTTCASRILGDFNPPYDATVIEKINRERCVIIGKTNMDEFAMGSSTENSAFGVTRNPWDINRIPGGSSGGSAASVAANMTIISLGSDTGGSIRQPAAFCGVVGLKPTYGRVSRYGLIAFASSLDQIGPFTKDVTDSALLMNLIAGHDPRDSTSAKVEHPDFMTFLGRDIKGKRLGIPKEFFIPGMDERIEKAIKSAIKRFEKLGAICEEVSLPHTEYAVGVYYLVATAEASSNLARYDGVQYGYRNTDADNIIDMFSRTRDEGFGAEVKRRIMLGTFALSAGYYDAYYLKALKVRTLIKNDFDKVFNNFDAIVAPTTPTPPFRIGEKADNPLQMYLSDIFTISVNLAGIPAISIPCGLTDDGLPIGLQIMAPAFEEGRIFTLAHAFELDSPWKENIFSAVKGGGR